MPQDIAPDAAAEILEAAEIALRSSYALLEASEHLPVLRASGTAAERFLAAEERLRADLARLDAAGLRILGPCAGEVGT